MARPATQIVADIRAFHPTEGNWRRLDDLFGELWATGEAGVHVRDMLGVLEQYPADDGAGVLWSIVHGVESLPGYESELIWSLRRRPSELGVTMVGRLLKSGVSEADGTSLVGLLREIAASATAPESVRKTAGLAISKARRTRQRPCRRTPGRQSRVSGTRSKIKGRAAQTLWWNWANRRQLTFRLFGF